MIGKTRALQPAGRGLTSELSVTIRLVRSQGQFVFSAVLEETRPSSSTVSSSWAIFPIVGLIDESVSFPAFLQNPDPFVTVEKLRQSGP